MWFALNGIQLYRTPEHNERVGRFKLLGQIGGAGGGGSDAGEIKLKTVQ
jgi:hypothetical protein